MTKELLSGVYDRAAVTYGDVRYFPRYAKTLVDRAGVPPDGRVLDVACGRGAVLFEVVERLGAGTSVIGVDLARGMVVQTSRDITTRRLANAETLQMDAENLGFPDSTFDRVFCAFSLQFLPDLQSALREFRRVVKPSGLVAVSTWGADDPRWDWYDDLVVRYKAKSSLRTQRMDSVEKMKRVFVEAEFTSVEVAMDAPDFVYADEDEWWNMRRSLSGRASLELLSPADLKAFTAEANRELAGMKEADGLHERQELLYTLARKA